MDKIEIKALCISTHIGVYEWEQRLVQNLFLDLTILKDLKNCNDDLTKTIDYEKICNRVCEFVEQSSFALIETVAEKVAELIKVEFNIDEISVRVSKPYAIKNAKDVAVTVVR